MVIVNKMRRFGSRGNFDSVAAGCSLRAARKREPRPAAEVIERLALPTRIKRQGFVGGVEARRDEQNPIAGVARYGYVVNSQWRFHII